MVYVGRQVQSALGGAYLRPRGDRQGAVTGEVARSAVRSNPETGSPR